jgi:hypothetical protein
VLHFFRNWHQKSARFLTAKSKIIFHLAALALAGGIVAGMYFQGLRKEYRAAWESTFLDAPGLHSLLGVALGPATKVTGISIPPVEALAAMRLHPDEIQSNPNAGGNAAPFIHLWAATAGLFIGIPRLLLLALALKEAGKTKPDWTADLDELEKKLRVQSTGQTAVVDVVPVYYSPEPSAAEAIRSVVLQVWGGKTRLNFLAPVELGEEEEYMAQWQPSETGTVLAFSFANTPEQDVQGELVKSITESPNGSKLLVVTDALSFEQRHHALPEYHERLRQRQAAWQRVLGEDVAWINLSLATKSDLLTDAANLRSMLT